MSSLIKEKNRSVKHLLYYYERLAFSKLEFNREENLKKCTTFEERKGTRYIRKTFILALSSSAVFRLQNHVSDFF